MQKTWQLQSGHFLGVGSVYHPCRACDWMHRTMTKSTKTCAHSEDGKHSDDNTDNVNSERMLILSMISIGNYCSDGHSIILKIAEQMSF